MIKSLKCHKACGGDAVLNELIISIVDILYFYIYYKMEKFLMIGSMANVCLSIKTRGMEIPLVIIEVLLKS